MSEAPRRIASTSTLLMNLTTGVSSPLASTPESLTAFVVAAADLEALPCLRCRHRIGQGVGRFQPLVDRALDPVLVDQDRFHRQVGVELDLVQRVGVGRIADAHEQPAAALEQRQRAHACGPVPR